MSDARLFVVTGIMAAGKSTVAEALASRFPRAAHVRGDYFRRAVVAGREEMGAEPSAEAFDQLRLRYRLAVTTAEAYVDAGFTTVLQDVIIGPLLGEVVELIRVRPFSLIVLAPSSDEVERRERGRNKTGYRGVSPDDLDRVLRTDTPRLGYWLDSTTLTVEQTVDAILGVGAESAQIG